MTFHRDQEQFVRARWRRGILFPAWAVQAALLLGVLGVFSYRLADTAEHFADNRAAGKVPSVELAWEVTNVSLGVVSLVLTVMEAVRWLAETLTPFFLLAAHIVKLTGAAAMLALDVVVYIHRSEGNWSAVGLALDVVLVAAMLVLFGYAVFTYRRLVQSYDDYYHGPSHNAKGFGFGSGYDEIELGGGPADRTSMRGLVGHSAAMGTTGAGPYNDRPTAYDPHGAGAGATAAATAGGEAGRRSRSHSAASSLRGSPSGGRPSGVLADDGRRASYNHERDTQFDSYVMNRTSAVLSKDDVDRAISTELWGTARPPSGSIAVDAGRTGAAGAVERSNSVVATGVVARPAARVQRDVIDRAVSWNVEHELASVPGSLHEDYDGTSTLRTVGSVATIAEEYEGGQAAQARTQVRPPNTAGHAYGERAQDEDEVDADALAHGRYRTKGANEDRALLMGHSRHGSLEEDEAEDDERGPIPDTAAHGR
ncbi:uncharacterized protein SPSK_01715 [Sporothrix schenckii 1099-18]|uniref:MARVEL domain-containing protein n=2 Tax=Sporothrix schenckii TaxID=29908 RepID=U7PIT3_SPOS1|nr:uncharacterized protein SPSK_01715 [Sporothrix schenckii 1099-18]ERS95427.1 hypothetical protein HMPREF1624_08305 [Sporothrix schenckii ATCC 58251]KJR87437.1 hypothetical protein SPSK_01715 [Sporothrix schenckii 1099-18]